MIQACLRVFLAALLIAPLFAMAQTVADDGPDYARWNSAAGRAEKAIDARSDTNSVFESLRVRITGFRDEFDIARQANQDRIATLREQLAVLGDPPGATGSEPPETTARRQELTEQLQRFQVPVKTAQEAFTRADGIIREIDNIIRERQAQRLLTLGPSPLNPALWPEAGQQFSQALADLLAERRVFSDPLHLEKARANLPVVLALLFVAGVLLAKGRAWPEWLGASLREMGGRGTGLWTYVISLLRVILPVLGLLAFSRALLIAGLVGLRGTAILEVLPYWGAILLGARWLSETLFARDENRAYFQLEPALRARARRDITGLAIIYVLRDLLNLLTEFSDFSNATQAVLGFPLLLALGALLFRFGQVLRHYRSAPATEGAPASITRFPRLVRSFGTALCVLALAAPILAAIGYEAVGAALLYPSVLTVAIFGAVLSLQSFFSALYATVTGKAEDAAQDSLIVVLINFLLVLGCTPFLALVWGARVADLSELWSQFLLGFQLGDTRISPADFLTFAILFIAGYILTRMFQSALRNSVLPKTKIDAGGQNAIASGVGYLGIFVTAIIAISSAGIDLSSIALVAGALSVGIGFGLQNIVSNFVSGIILLIERPITEGDWIEVGGHMGYVRNISVRSTRIETFDRSDVIVPNSDLVSGSVTNYTRGNTVGRVIIPVGVAYGTDTRKVEEILREVAESHPMVMPSPSVVFQSFGASSLDFEIRAILRDVNWMLSVKSEMNHKIAQRFAEEGIEIPFPQQDVWIRSAKPE